MRYVSNCSRRRNTSSAEWDVESIGRALRLLERSVSNGAGLVVFPSDTKAIASSSTRAAKSRKGKVSRSDSPEEEARDIPELSENEIKAGEDMLDALQVAGVASACIMTILTASGLPKHVSCRRRHAALTSLDPI